MSIKGRKKFNQTKTTERKKMWAHPWTSWKRNWTNTEFNKNYSYIFCVFCYVCIVTGPNYQWVNSCSAWVTIKIKIVKTHTLIEIPMHSNVQRGFTSFNMQTHFFFFCIWVRIFLDNVLRLWTIVSAFFNDEFVLF